MRLTWANAKTFLARYAASGACSTDPRVLERLNEARERLMKKPQNWKGKLQRFVFCINKACLTLPREIETIEGAAICNVPMRMRSPWYEVLEGGPGVIDPCRGGCDYHRAFVDRGEGFVTFADLCTPRNIKIYADVAESSGARLLLQGFDDNGNRVRTFDTVTNAYVDGEYVGINNATPQVSNTVFSSLDGIVKPETNGFVRIYAFTAGTAGTPANVSTTVENYTAGGIFPTPGVIWQSPPGVVQTVSYYNWPDESATYIAALVDTDASEIPQWGGTLYNIDGTLATSTTGYANGLMPENSWNGPEPVGTEVGEESIRWNIQGGTPSTKAFFIELDNWPQPTASGEMIVLKITRTFTAEVLPTADYLSQIGILHPDETNPSYRRYYVPLLENCDESVTPERKQVVVIGKLRYLPVKRDTDFLVIENFGALKLMLLALNDEDKGAFDEALKKEMKAEKILQDELQNFMGDAATNNTPVQVQTPGLGAGDLPCIL